MLMEIDENLDTEQKAAILEEGSVFLSACPGSGKTRTLTYKLALELSKLDSNKKFVAAITYTNRAADEIQDRIEKMGVDTSNLWIGTIHSFCLEWIIKPYGIYHEKLKAGFRVIDPNESEKIINEIGKNYKITNWDCGHYYDDTGRHLSCTEKGKHENINIVLDKYSEQLNRNGQIDFNQILLYSHELLCSNVIARKLLNKIFPYILVDEYQDTQRIQYLIISSIISVEGGDSNIFIVGDPNQAIYNSLGGYSIDISEFQSMCQKTLKPLFLNKNYRSSEKIVGYFNNFSLTETPVVSASKLKDYSSVITHNTEVSKDDLLTEVTRLIRHSVDNLGIEQKEICVVAPWWVHLSALTRRLVASMPDYQFDGPGITPFSSNKDNFWYKFSKIALTESSPDIYLRRLRWAGQIIDELALIGVDTSHLSKKRLLRDSNTIESNELDGLKYLHKYFKEMSAKMNVDIDQHLALREHFDAFFESSKNKIEHLKEEDPNYSPDLDTFKKVFKVRSGITVSSIHGVKGLEYDVVIAFGLLEGMVPHFTDTQDSASRLLYVISSRAKKNLHLISETGRKVSRWSGQDRTVTVRLSECNYNYD
jgi:DNA helicase II / ATP-dependent DNA helicase PcrA